MAPHCHRTDLETGDWGVTMLQSPVFNSGIGGELFWVASQKVGKFVGRIVNPTVRNAIPHDDTPKY
jgi:hypothetical protein